MYMINSMDSNGFTISSVMSKALRIVIFDGEVKPIIDERISGAKQGIMLLRPLSGHPEVVHRGAIDSDTLIMANLGFDTNVMMIEDAGEVLTHRMFISVSEYNSAKFLLSSEPPHWMSQDDIHFLYKFGKPASSVPEKPMTFAEATWFQLDRMKASLEDPTTTIREAQAKAVEELRDMHVVIVDDDDDGLSEEDYAEMSEEEFAEVASRERSAAKCGYVDIAASLAVLMEAEEHQKYHHE